MIKALNAQKHNDLAIVEDTASYKMTSGTGQYHSNESTAKNPTPYTSLSFDDVKSMVDNPQSVDKSQAKWLIPSTLGSRNFKDQEENGQFWLLWADIDKNPHGLTKISEIVTKAVGGSDYEIYTSRSATADNMKCRVLIPLDNPLTGHDWVIAQELLNNHFEDNGIEPDRASERPAQLLYLPNRGNVYETRTQRDGLYFNPLRTWAKAINEREKELIAEAKALETAKAEAMAKKAARASFDNISLIDAFNEQYPIQDILIQAGYSQRGNSFRHPHSESGSYSATVKDGRIHALSKIDALYTDTGAHDAFSAFEILFHGGNRAEAMKDAGNNWLAIGSVSFNKHQQRAYMQSQSETNVIDIAGLINKDQRVNTGIVQPEDLDEIELAHDYPIFEDSQFYGVAGNLARLASKDSEASSVAVYFSFLTSAAAMLGRYKYLQVGESKHHARLFTTIVGASGRSRKGTSFNPVERIIKQAELAIQALNDNVGNLAQYSPPNSLQIKSGLSSSEGLAFAVRDASDEIKSKDGLPLWDAVEDKRLLIVEQEFASVFKVAQREGNRISQTIRDAWDGNTLESITKNNRLKATNPHINILGHITQHELKRVITDDDIYNGLANRFLWACVRRTKKLAFPQPMDDKAVYDIATQLYKAFKAAEDSPCNEIRLDDEARQYWNVKYHEISVDKYGVLGALTSRSETQVLRVALLFCLLDCATMVTASHLKAAVHVVEYSEKSCEFVFTTPIAGNPDEKKLLIALESGALTQTEVSRVFGGHKSREELTKLLTGLQSINKIRKQQQPGKKTVMWGLI